MLSPATRYRDCDAALDFMTTVLGMSEHAVFRDDDGRIVHGQMKLARGMMMFGPPQDGPFDAYMVDPSEIGGRETTTIYAIVPDIDARYADVSARCDAKGGRILLPMDDQGHGGKAFRLADPEGHIWTFGNYDPCGDGASG